MLINEANLQRLFAAYHLAFKQGLETAPKHYEEIAMTVPSTTSENVYAWLGQFPRLREWIGDRVIAGLAAQGFTIKNRDFESTITVGRNHIEDDQYGLFGPIAKEMGMAAGDLPNELTLGLLGSGFVNLCYDGKPFFAADHPVGAQGQLPQALAVSNVQAGSGTPWYLLDTSRAIKPLIFQRRRDGEFTALDDPHDPNVFFKKQYIYGIDSRMNAGYGLWQLAYASKAELTPANYEAARQAMMELTGDSGRPLNIKPTVMVVPPSLEGAAMRLLNNGTRIEVVEDVPVPIQNEWQNTAKPIVTAWLA